MSSAKTDDQLIEYASNSGFPPKMNVFLWHSLHEPQPNDEAQQAEITLDTLERLASLLNEYARTRRHPGNGTPTLLFPGQ